MVGQYREKTTGRIFTIRCFMSSDIRGHGDEEHWLNFRVRREPLDGKPYVEVPPDHFRCYANDDAIAISTNNDEVRVIRQDCIDDQFEKHVEPHIRLNYSNPTEADLGDLFTYHAPTDSQRIKYEQLRSAGREFARQILALCPETPDRTTALRSVREAVLWANASIAIGR